MALEISEQTFAVPEEKRLKLSNVRGHVNIHAGEAGDQILVKATLDTESGDAERTKVEMRQEESGEVVVKTHYTEPFWGFFNRLQPCRVDYDVTVPANCEVRASTVSADLVITGVRGKQDLSTVSGELELDRSAGELSASTVSGGIQAHELAGGLKAHSVSGTLNLEGQGLETIDASTVSGGIRLSSPLSAGPYKFHTVSGDIHWQLPSAAACTIEMHTVSGRAHVNLPTTLNSISNGNRVIQVQGGGTRIPFNSVSGSFYLAGPEVKPGATHNVEEPIAAQPEQMTDRLDVRTILERIENGEMTAEEGIAALKS